MEEKIKDFIDRLGADGYHKGKTFKGYEVYVPDYDREVTIGYPLVVMVKDDEVRLSTTDESMEYLAMTTEKTNDDEPAIMQGKGEEE